MSDLGAFPSGHSPESCYGWGTLPFARPLILGTFCPLDSGFRSMDLFEGPFRRLQFLGVTGTFGGYCTPSSQVPPFRLSPWASTGSGGDQAQLSSWSHPALADVAQHLESSHMCTGRR